jgi:hypothetical protein
MDEAKDVANRHLLAIPASKYQLGAALAFPILEGALARKNRAFVHADGRASQALEVPDAAEKTGKKKFGHNGRVNRLKHQLRIFEVYEVARRGRAASWLVPLYDEIALLAGAPKRDIPEAIDAWRNALLHGNSYWTAKFASMMNLISMLVLDELDPGEYRTHRAKAVSTIAFMGPEWPFFVPDVR